MILGKPAFLSSTYDSSHVGLHKASYANDGVYRPQGTIGIAELSSIAHSLREDNPWWRVDLLRLHCIWAVNVLNRGDCKYILDISVEPKINFCRMQQ